MQLTVQNQVMDLIRGEEGAHRSSGEEEVQAIRNSTATYHGQPISFLYAPKFFTQEGKAFLKEQSETMWKILEKVMHQYLENAEYRALFGFDSELEEMILRRPKYETILPVCRLDIFLNEETGEYKFCEFNADGSSAMNEDRELVRTYQGTKLYQEMDQMYEQDSFELFDSLANAFVRIMKEDPSMPQKPSIAVVDFMELGCSAYEFEEFRRAFERVGLRAYVCEIRQLTYDGEHLYTDSGEQIDAIYRRAVTSDIMDRAAEIGPFLQAVKDEKVCLLGNFCTQIIHDKILFRLIHEKETAAFLSAEENAFIEAHVPYTAILTKEVVEKEKIIENREHWLLKPQNSYGAHGVYAGIHHTNEEWEQVVSKFTGKGYIAQEFIRPYLTENVDFKYPNSSIRPYSNLTGMYVYGGEFAGCYSRASGTEIISAEYDEYDLATIVVKARK